MNFPGLADPYPPFTQQTGGCLLRIASHASHSDGDGNCHALLEVMEWEGGWWLWSLSVFWKVPFWEVGYCDSIKWQILQIHCKSISKSSEFWPKIMKWFVTQFFSHSRNHVQMHLCNSVHILQHVCQHWCHAICKAMPVFRWHRRYQVCLDKRMKWLTESWLLGTWN